MVKALNIDEMCYLGGERHTWDATGLDINKQTLVTTRRCLRCDAEQVKSYGAGGRTAWRSRRAHQDQEPTP